MTIALERAGQDRLGEISEPPWRTACGWRASPPTRLEVAANFKIETISVSGFRRGVRCVLCDLVSASSWTAEIQWRKSALDARVMSGHHCVSTTPLLKKVDKLDKFFFSLNVTHRQGFDALFLILPFSVRRFTNAFGLRRSMEPNLTGWLCHAEIRIERGRSC